MMSYPLAFIPQGPELWVILVVILILFGGKKIPELMRGVGKGVGELHKGLEEGRQAVQRSVDEEAAKPTEPAETTPAQGSSASDKK